MSNIKPLAYKLDINFTVTRNDIDIDLIIFGDVDFNPANHGHPDLRHPEEISVEITECFFREGNINEEWDGELTSKEQEEVNLILWQQFKTEIEERKVNV